MRGIWPEDHPATCCQAARCQCLPGCGVHERILDIVSKKAFPIGNAFFDFTGSGQSPDSGGMIYGYLRSHLKQMQLKCPVQDVLPMQDDRQSTMRTPLQGIIWKRAANTEIIP